MISRTLLAILMLPIFMITTPLVRAADDFAATRQCAVNLYNANNFTDALPLLEKLAATKPDDVSVLEMFGFCLVANTSTLTDAEARKKARLHAREILLRAKQLGDDSSLLKIVLDNIPADGSDSKHSFSQNPVAEVAMRDGEAAFVHGELDKAVIAYQRALAVDPQCYEAALFTGDVYFKQNQHAQADEWFAKAVQINPNRETAHRYWGDDLIAQGKTEEARDKFIDAVIAGPYRDRRPWVGIQQWAEDAKLKFGHPQISIPIQLQATKPSDDIIVDDTKLNKQDGSNLWMLYGATRAEWKKTIFAQTFPDEKEYRHSLREEVAALKAVAVAVAQDRKVGTIQQPNSSLVTLLKLNEAGLLEPYVLLACPDDGIMKDYKVYRTSHRDELRRYLREFFLHPRP